MFFLTSCYRTPPFSTIPFSSYHPSLPPSPPSLRFSLLPSLGPFVFSGPKNTIRAISLVHKNGIPLSGPPQKGLGIFLQSRKPPSFFWPVPGPGVEILTVSKQPGPDSGGSKSGPVRIFRTKIGTKSGPNPDQIRTIFSTGCKIGSPDSRPGRKQPGANSACSEPPRLIFPCPIFPGAAGQWVLGGALCLFMQCVF